jgi:hypothetical protein
MFVLKTNQFTCNLNFNINLFNTIRKQLIWGNKYIKVKGKSLLFNNWINSNLIYINDLLDEKGKLTEEFICKKLKCNLNWISEIYTGIW